MHLTWDSSSREMLELAVFLLVAASAVSEVLPMYDGRIVGGKPTSIENYPYQVSLEKLSKAHFCGGSIYSEKYVITAAHCVDTKKAEQFNVRVGTSRHGSGGQVYTLEWVKVHPSFTREKMHGDVAVLKLKDPIAFGPTVQLIQLAHVKPRQGEQLTVTGWGTLKYEDNNLPDVLQVVRVPSLDRPLCAFAYGAYKLTEAMICAGVSRKDSCQGDSGGPLVNDKRELVGIVSFGKGCATPGFPGIYTNVASDTVREFILESTRE